MERPSSDTELMRHALSAVAWEDLLSPLEAITGQLEITLSDCNRLGLAGALPDLDRIAEGARTLSALVMGLHAGTSSIAADDGVVSAEAKLRHDLRTPLNAIIGYGEMALEDLADLDNGATVIPGFEHLLAAGRQMLERIDTIVDLTRKRETTPPHEGEAAILPDLISGLLRTMSPVAGPSRASEIARILVVDDNASNRNLLARRLAQDGHEVTETHSGPAAFALLDREEVDLILLDVLMPEMNGLEVLTRLKADERWYGIPVIMISGLKENETVLKCIELGADDYLPKPCDVVLLRARINACLERTRWRTRERDILDSLRLEKERSERLLLNILPQPIVTRLNGGETIIADRFESASILFADIVGFTAAAARLSASSLVAQLDRLFTAFDARAHQHGVEKIKTIGDAYMAASGLPEVRHDHAEQLAEFALGILDSLDEINDGTEAPFSLRIGMHCGPVVAGVIGRRKFIYDVWGDTVNVASRHESHGVPGRIQVSEEMMQALRHRFRFEPRGAISLKGRGESTAYLLVR